jgi:dihydroorotate dehydrogenase
MNLPRYDREQSYRWNYEHPPAPVQLQVPTVPGDWNFVGLPVASPLGISAGPLLNGDWCLYYAGLGFDVLTYKTVRSAARECYPLPNLVPVDCGLLRGNELHVATSDQMEGSWAVSFGMPSANPDVWRRNIASTRTRLPNGKLLNVSVVGTPQDDWSIDDLADDYARCAQWAGESGADCIETNLSCPNVATCDGQVYHNPIDARTVVRRVRTEIGRTPLIVKIGHCTDRGEAKRLLESLGDLIDAFSMTNSVASRVLSSRGEFLFNGDRRGICGTAIREASLSQVRMFSDLLRANHSVIQLIGGGGVTTADHVRQYLDSGANAVHMATSAMVDPMVAVTIKQQFAERIG